MFIRLSCYFKPRGDVFSLLMLVPEECLAWLGFWRVGGEQGSEAELDFMCEHMKVVGTESP